MFCSPTLMGKKPYSTISKYKYLEAAQLFHWATMVNFILWFTGRYARHRRTETILPRLVKKGKLVARRYGKRLVYTVPRRKNDSRIEHGLGCTEGLVRIWRSKMDGLIIAERYLRGHNMVPEWGILYKNEKLLLYEFCTEDNFARKGVIKSKITRYHNNLGYLEEKYSGEAIVLFVVDAERSKIKRFVKENETGDQFFFTDYKTFLDVPMGGQLRTPIYIWEDGRVLPLQK